MVFGCAIPEPQCTVALLRTAGAVLTTAALDADLYAILASLQWDREQSLLLAPVEAHVTYLGEFHALIFVTALLRIVCLIQDFIILSQHVTLDRLELFKFAIAPPRRAIILEVKQHLKWLIFNYTEAVLLSGPILGLTVAM